MFITLYLSNLCLCLCHCLSIHSYFSLSIFFTYLPDSTYLSLFFNWFISLYNHCRPRSWYRSCYIMCSSLNRLAGLSIWGHKSHAETFCNLPILLRLWACLRESSLGCRVSWGTWGQATWWLEQLRPWTRRRFRSQTLQSASSDGPQKTRHLHSFEIFFETKGFSKDTPIFCMGEISLHKICTHKTIQMYA